MIAPTPRSPLTIITHEFFPTSGGIATFVEEMARGCHELGLPVEVWAPRTFTPSNGRFPYPVRRVSIRGTHDPACVVRMMREIHRQREPLRDHLIYLPEPGPMLALAWLSSISRFRPASLLLTFHGSEIQRFARRPASRLLIGRLIRGATRVSTPSEFSRDLLHDHFPMAVGKTVVTRGAPRARFCARQRPKIRTSSRVVIVTVGRLHPRKGQMHMLEALDRLPPETAGKVEYWIVGRGVRGDYEARLRQRARRCRVPVSFFGSLDDDELEIVYGRADLFAMTSVPHGTSVEGFGLAYLEASSFGLPVVGHAVGGVAEAVRDGETGLLVRPGDTAALAAALQRLVEDQHLRQRLGANGRAWARRHSWRDAAQVLLDGLAELPHGIAARRVALQSA